MEPTVIARAMLGLMLTLLVGCGPTLLWYGRSPDRAHGAALLAEGSGQRLLLDEVAQAPWDAVGVTHLRWAETGPVYPARLGDRWHLVEAGRAGPGYEAIGEVEVDGARVAYCALDAEGWRVVVGGEAGPTFRSIRAGSLRWLADDRGVLYVGRDARGERVVAGAVDALGPPFEAVSTPVVGAKGALVGYVGTKDGRAQLVIGGEAGPLVQEIVELAVAHDEPRWAAVTREGDGYALLRDELGGAPSRLDGPPAALVLSADGARVAWSTRAEDGLAVWLDGAPVASGLEGARHLSFVPRTGALVFTTRESGGARVYHAGTPGPSFEAIEDLVVSEAGHWAYVGRRADGEREVFVGGVSRFRGAWAGALALPRARPGFVFLAQEGERSFVVAPGGRVEVESPFADSLVLDAEGCWAITVARPEHRRVDIVASSGVGSVVVATLDVGEVSAAFLQRRPPTRAVREIVAGELMRARREGRACSR